MQPAPTAASTSWQHQIALTELLVTLRPDREWRLPPLPAVMVRGALGLAMYEAACTRDDRDCPACEHQITCPIPTWFAPHRLDSSRMPPYVLAVKPGMAGPDRPVRARVVLFGPVPRPDLVCAALMRLAQAGLGPDRVPHTVERAFVRGQGVGIVMARDGADLGRWPAPAPLARWISPPPEPPAAIRLHVRTALSSRATRRDAPPTPAEIVDLAIQRARFVARQLDERLERWWPSTTEVRGAWERATWTDQGRFSRRQGSRQDLSGWTGRVVIEEPGPWLDALLAAEVLHLGKGATAGLGEVGVEVIG